MSFENPYFHSKAAARISRSVRVHLIKVQLESKVGARYSAVGDLVSSRFSRVKRGECCDLLAVENYFMPCPLRLN